MSTRTEIKKISYEIIDTSMFYWGLSRSLKVHISKLKNSYLFRFYAVHLSNEDTQFFDAVVWIYSYLEQVKGRLNGTPGEDFKQYIEYIRSYTFKKRKLLKEFLDSLKLVNDFMINEWYRGEMIDLIKENLSQCETIYFLATDLSGYLTNENL